MIQVRRERLINISFFILLFSLLIYIIARAVSVGMTHDEAYSFHNVKKFWYAEVLCTGNSHWFNLAAIKAALLAGLDKTWQLRWFGMFSAAVFLWIGYLWIKNIKELSVKLFVLAFAFLNPYLLDYFSLARGYSNALMFEVLSVCFFVLANKSQKRSHFLLALLASGAAAIANFNFFYFFCAFCLVYFSAYHLKKGKEIFKKRSFYFDVLFVSGVCLLVLRALLFIRECSNDIAEYGGETFVNSIFYGFADTLIYKNFSIPGTGINTVAYTLFGLVLISAFVGVFNRRHSNFIYTTVSSVLLVMFLLLIINKFAFHVLYPTYRTTLMFYPLFAIVISCFFIEIIKMKQLKQIVLGVLTAVLIFNFCLSINFKSVFDYPQQADAKECFDFLKSQNAKRVGIDPEVFGVFTNYYQLTKNPYPFYGESIHTYLPNSIGTEKDKLLEFDYIVVIPPYNLSYYKNNSVALKKIKMFPNAHTVVLKVEKRE